MPQGFIYKSSPFYQKNAKPWDSPCKCNLHRKALALILYAAHAVCFRERKDYFPPSLSDSSFSGLYIHNPHLMTHQKRAACRERDSQTQRPLSLISAQKKVGCFSPGQPEAMERCLRRGKELERLENELRIEVESVSVR